MCRVIAVGILVLLGCSSAWAQTPPTNTLTSDQCATLKTNIMADSSLDTLRMNREDQAIADIYNIAASPLYWVFKSTVTKAEMLFTKSIDNTSFTFVGNGFITRAQGEIEAFHTLFDPNNRTTCMLPNVVQALTDIFSGTGNAAANRTHLAAICRRTASRIEKLFVGSTGCTGGTAAAPNGPCNMGFEGPANANHIACALNIP